MDPGKGEHVVSTSRGCHLLSRYQVSVQHYVKCHTDLPHSYKTPIEQMRKLRLKNRLIKLPQISKSVNGKGKILFSLCYWPLHFISLLLKTWPLNWHHQRHMRTRWKSKLRSPPRPAESESLVMGPRNRLQPALHSTLYPQTLANMYISFGLRRFLWTQEININPFLYLNYENSSYHTSNHNFQQTEYIKWALRKTTQ